MSILLRGLGSAGSAVPVLYYWGLLASDAPATVDLWPARSGSRLGAAFQHTAADQPTVVSGKVRFDGSSDYIFVPPGNTPSRVNVPDASGGTPTEGFTITGICKASDNTIWAANDGRGASATPAPSLVHLSADGAIKLEEIILLPLYPSAGSVQGICFDPDGSLWFASIAENRLRNITTDGVDIRSIDVSATGTPNGLAYDVTNDRLVASFSSAIMQINPDTGAVTATLPSRSGVDQLHWSSDGILFASGGTNGLPGALYYLLPGDTGWCNAGRIREFDAAEGCIYDAAGTWRLANDAFFHSSPLVPKNQMLTMGHPFSDVTVLELHAKFTLLSTPSGSRPVMELGGQATAHNGVGMYVLGGTNNQIRIFANTAFGTTERAFVTKTCSPALTTESIIRARIDFANKQIRVWQNGTEIGSAVSIAAVDTSFRWRGGGNVSGGGSSALNMDLAGVFVTPQLTDAEASSLWN
jgi:hypothetical protein